MVMALAQSRGLFDYDDRISEYWPEFAQQGKEKITIRQLATHTSGLSDAEQDEIPHDRLTGWKGDFWKRTPDPFSIAVRQAS